MNAIATKAGIETGPCSKYLKTLIDLGIVKRETPITEKPGKKTIYLLADNFFRFWYRFVPQNIAAISSGRIRGLYDAAIKSYFPSCMGFIFEPICREYLLYYTENLPFVPTSVGQWWGNDPTKKREIQIDIVAPSADEKGFIIGSCKYRNEPVGLDELNLLQEYAAAFRKPARFHYYIFFKIGFTRDLQAAAERGEVRLLSLDDLL